MNFLEWTELIRPIPWYLAVTLLVLETPLAFVLDDHPTWPKPGFRKFNIYAETYNNESNSCMPSYLNVTGKPTPVWSSSLVTEFGFETFLMMETS
jgi:hypothetical protein